jgi:hypothetical protein
MRPLYSPKLETPCGEGRGRAGVRGRVPLECDGVGGALAVAPEPCDRTRASEPRAWRSRGGAQQRRGGFGTQGVTGVLRDGLSAKR